MNDFLVQRDSIKVCDNPNLSDDAKRCPVHLENFPNYMGVNLCCIDKIEWAWIDDQLVDVTVRFNVYRKTDEEDPNGNVLHGLWKKEYPDEIQEGFNK